MLIVNINAITVAMQTFWLESMKEGIENRGLDSTIYNPLMYDTGADGQVKAYVKDDILNLHKGPLK